MNHYFEIFLFKILEVSWKKKYKIICEIISIYKLMGDLQTSLKANEHVQVNRRKLITKSAFIQPTSYCIANYNVGDSSCCSECCTTLYCWMNFPPFHILIPTRSSWHFQRWRNISGNCTASLRRHLADSFRFTTSQHFFVALMTFNLYKSIVSPHSKALLFLANLQSRSICYHKNVNQKKSCQRNASGNSL